MRQLIQIVGVVSLMVAPAGAFAQSGTGTGSGATGSGTTGSGTTGSGTTGSGTGSGSTGTTGSRPDTTRGGTDRMGTGPGGSPSTTTPGTTGTVPTPGAPPRTGAGPSDMRSPSATGSADTATVPESDREVLRLLHQDNQKEIAMGQLAQDKGESPRVKALGRRLVQEHTSADRKIEQYLKRKNMSLAMLEMGAGMGAGTGASGTTAGGTTGSGTTGAGSGATGSGTRGPGAPGTTGSSPSPGTTGPGAGGGTATGTPGAGTAGRPGMEHDAAHARLQTLSGAEFDREFASTMAREHEKTIQMVKDSQDRVTDPQLRTMLKGLVPTLERHRKTAADLSQRLGDGT